MGEGRERKNRTTWRAITKLPKWVQEVASRWPEFKEICRIGSHFVIEEAGAALSYMVNIVRNDGTRGVVRIDKPPKK